MVIISDSDYEQLQFILHRAKHQSSLPSREIEDVEFEEISLYCTYLDIDAIKKIGIWTPAQVQAQLEQASKKGAKEFAAFLHDFEHKTYLNFHGDNKRTIYQTFRAQLPMMRTYQEKNFYYYF